VPKTQPESEPEKPPKRLVGGKQLVSYPVGRVCAHPQCTTALSRYNKLLVCALHTQPG
jgi:hypothetical protein